MAYRHKVDESGALGPREDALPPLADDPDNAVARWSDGVEWTTPGFKASPTAKKPPMLELPHAGNHGKVKLQAVEQKGKTLLILSHTDEHGARVQVAQVVLSSLPEAEHARAKDPLAPPPTGLEMVGEFFRLAEEESARLAAGGPRPP